jgi:hypothetical protein
MGSGKADRDYTRFTRRQNLDRDLHHLEGLVRGIAIDGRLNSAEAGLLSDWSQAHLAARSQHPYNEICAVVDRALGQGFITGDQLDDLSWLIRNLQAGSIFYDSVTSDIQRLHGILQGILADGVIEDSEIEGLSQWLQDHESLKGCYPYDEVDSFLTQILADHRVDDCEREALASFLRDFVGVPVSATGEQASGNPRELSLSGVCAVCPEISFDGRRFCFTGDSAKGSRDRLEGLVTHFGGVVSPSVTRELDFLIVGSQGNPCWAFACYGRKVEKAVHLRRQGHRVLIVHENDFWDACLDRGLPA